MSEDPTDWPHSQRFACSTTGCTYSHLLPEHPTRGPTSVRAGCPWCETLTLAGPMAAELGLPPEEVADDVAREASYVSSNGREAGRYYQGKYEAYLEGMRE